MKIKVYKHIVMFLLPAALTGCSGKEDSLPGTGEAGLEIENCFSRSAGTDTGHVPVQDFGMVLLDETGGSYTGVSNPLHVTYGESWNFPQVTLTQQTCRLFAFSPFRSIPGKEVAVSLSPQTDYLASDEVRLDWQNRRASIEMKHLLSLLAFTVDGSRACSLNVEAVPTEATYDLTGGTLSVNEGSGTVSSKENILLLLPGRLEERKAQIRYLDRTYDWYLPANTFEAGKRYDYALTLSKEGVLMLSGVSARPWETGGDYTGTEPYNPKISNHHEKKISTVRFFICVHPARICTGCPRRDEPYPGRLHPADFFGLYACGACLRGGPAVG